MSQTIMIIGFLGFAFFAQVAAHGHMSAPLTRDSFKIYSDQNAPVAYPLASDFVCRNDAPLDQSKWTTLTAGQNTNMTWALEAPHPGDCFAYISYDADLPDTQKRWFKVAEWNDCNMMNSAPQTFTIPSYLPSSNHALLRWEWYALHLQSINIVEFYSQCTDVKIVGSSNGQLPTPQVTIPGHLPMDAKFYRNEDLEPSKVLFTGPPKATLGGADWSCQSVYGSACVTPAPNNNPCNISSQRCLTESTFQACGIGRTTTEWGPAQSCQTGLVCRPSADATRIYCDRPSTPASVPVPTPPASTPAATPSAPSTPAATPSAPAPSAGTPASQSPAPQSSNCALRTMKCNGGAAYSICTNGAQSNYWANKSCNIGETCVQNGDSVYCAYIPVATTPSAPSTPASSAPSTPATTGAAATVPATPSAPTTPSTTPSTSVCTNGEQRCSTTGTYQQCALLRDGTPYWAAPQNCQVGLTCHPNGKNVYCY